MMSSAKLLELMLSKIETPSTCIKDLFEFFTMIYSTPEGKIHLYMTLNMPYIYTQR